MQTRTYAATLAPLTGAAAGDGYALTLDSPPVALDFTVSGHDVGFATDDFAPVSEAALSLTVFASATGSVTTSPAVISLPLAYQFTYKGQPCRGSDGIFTLTANQ